MIPDLADTKPSIWSALIFVAMALVLIPTTKWALNKWPVPGLTDLANAM